MKRSSSTHAVYRCFEGDRLIYVGATSDPDARLRHHQAKTPWWHRVTEVTLEFYPKRWVAFYREGLTIKAEAPELNVMHNTMRGAA